METTDPELIPYPEPNDPGNGALDLQLIAERVDALATAQIAEFRRIINKPMRVYRLGSNSPNLAANQSINCFTFSGWAPLYDSTGVSVGSSGFSQDGLGTTPGLYHLGATIFSAVLGGVDTNTLRQIELRATIPSDATQFPASVTIKNAYSTGYEPNSGTYALSAELEVFTPVPSVGPGTHLFAGTIFNLFFLHRNTSSDIQVQAGSLAYIYRAGDIEA